jgi:fucose 4-O-acetylase-like acetyltransferase
MASKRILYLDLVKLFTIYLVIVGHVIQAMVDGLIIDRHLYKAIYSFHMPLFMLLSGYFFCSSTKTTFTNILKTKAKQLLVPAFTCTFICCIYLSLFHETPNYIAELIGNSWFLKTLFVIYIVMYFLKQIHINDYALMVLSCAILFIMPSASTLQINFLFPFFWCGYLFRKHNLLEKISFSWKYVLIFLLQYIFFYCLQQFYNVPNYIPISIYTLQNQGALICLRFCVAFLGCLCAITMISVVYKQLEKSCFINHIAKYGQKTLGVYVLQTIIVLTIFHDTLAWHEENELILDVLIAPSLALVFLVLCLFCIHILSKSKIIDLLLFGGQYYNSK